LRLTVNHLPAVCDDCSYQFNLAATPVVTSASLSGSTYTISITNPSSIVFTTADITVSLLGVPCSNVAGTISSFTCSLPTNGDGSVKIPAGSGSPQVHVAQIGFADNSGLTPSIYPISVSGSMPGQTAPGGGI
jgi:hypothetical protein